LRFFAAFEVFFDFFVSLWSSSPTFPLVREHILLHSLHNQKLCLADFDDLLGAIFVDGRNFRVRDLLAGDHFTHQKVAVFLLKHSLLEVIDWVFRVVINYRGILPFLLLTDRVHLRRFIFLFADTIVNLSDWCKFNFDIVFASAPDRIIHTICRRLWWHQKTLSART
jgi:hypothetical protein